MTIDTGEQALLRMLGLCRRAGMLVIGVPMICDALKSSKDKDVLVIEAGDCSENTHKKITDKCAYYNAEHTKISSGCEALGAALGKSAVAAVMVVGKDMCKAVKMQSAKCKMQN